MAQYTDFFKKHPVSRQSTRGKSGRQDVNDIFDPPDNDWKLAPARRDHTPAAPDASKQTIPPEPERIQVRHRRLESKSSDSDSDSDSSDPESKSPPGRSPPSCDAQIFCNPAIAQKDITLHFEMDVGDDIEGLLEELGRLKRLGWFNEALEYFEKNVKDHLDLPLVTIEYADLLIEQGAHQRFQELVRSKQLPPPRTSKIITGFSEDIDLYAAHCALLRQLSDDAFEGSSRQNLIFERMKSITHYLSERADQDFTPTAKENARLPLDSTEIQILRRHRQLRTASWDKRLIPLVGIPRPSFAALYQNALRDGRIWELGDIIHDLPTRTVRFLITVTEDSPEENEDIIERLIQDWALEEYDPSTELALLSILVSLAYNFERQHFAFAPRQRSKTAQFCLERADACASLIRENSPDLITSRPFLQWRLAKERLERHWGSPPRSADFRENEKLGLDPWGIPISTRKRSRGVVWPPVNPRFPPNDVLHAILRVSRENGDCRLEEECLSEMICRSDSPGPLLDQLGELQLSNGNNIGHLTTCLSKSLLVTDDSSVKRLIRELKQAGSLLCAPPEQDIRLHLRYAESVINGNLHEQLPGSENDVERYWDLSWRIHDTMESIRTRGAEPEPNPYSDSDETDDGQIETRVYRSRSRKDAELSAKVAKTKRKIARLEKQLETHRTSQGRTDTTSWNHRREGSTAGRADRETLKPQDNEHGPRPPSISRRRSRTRLRFRDRGEKDKGDKKERFEIVDPTDEKEEKSTPRVRRTSPSPESYRSVSDRRRATDKKSLDDEGIVIRRSGSFTRQRPAIEDFQGKQPVDGESEIPTEHPPVYQQEDSDVEPPAEPSAMPPSAEVGDELGDDNGKRVIEDDDSDFSETDISVRSRSR